jgi:cytochrome c oxidase accessory protein FixG
VYAQDIFWLAGFLIVAAFLLFFVTGIAGRVFCGYFCFQTLWTDVFQLIERLVQGERNARMKLAASAWNGNKIIRMSLTWLLWLSVSFWTGFSFTLYWSEAPVLVQQFFTGQAPFPAYATTLFLTATTFVMAGLAREQVCTYMCPYARFQGAMFDSDTLIVAYDELRGEREQGRAKPEKKLQTQEQRLNTGIGDCVDCGYCVQVCPMGIDIRNGLQYQCTSCALCVDACNTIMRTIKYPTGLIRYTSENQIQGGRTNWFKLKSIGYGLVIMIATALLSWSIGSRAAIEMSVQQVRQPLYVTLSDGSIQNRYEIKLTNKQAKSVIYSLSLKGLEAAKWEVRPSPEISLGPGQNATYQVKVWLTPGTDMRHEQDFVFELHRNDASVVVVSKQASFFIPQATR